MIGGQAVCIRAFVEGAVRVADILSHESAHKWVAPVFSVFILGATTYFVLELPSSVPCTVSRWIRNSLIKPESGQTSEEERFMDAHATRVACETCKVLRLALWDLGEHFRIALDERSYEKLEIQLTAALPAVAPQPGPSCLSPWKTRSKSKAKLAFKSPLKSTRRASMSVKRTASSSHPSHLTGKQVEAFL